MIRPTSKPRSLSFLNDFQVFKGNCERTMQPFGQPVSATHEARLMIEDDRGKLPRGTSALYAIHQRSENRILEIVEHVRVLTMPAPKQEQVRSRSLKAA